MIQSKKSTVGPSIVDLGDPAWYRAATLVERLALPGPAGGDAPDFSRGAEVGESRLKRWRSAAVFGDAEDRFAERLATDGATEGDLRRLLGETAETLRDRHPGPPAWLRELAAAFSEPALACPPSYWERSRWSDDHALGFLELVSPIIERGRDRLRGRVQDLADDAASLPLDPCMADELLLPDLLEGLAKILERTMVRELNVARLQGLLVGDTPQERFQSFVERLRDQDVALAYLREYPVLARQLVECVDGWVLTGFEFVRNLCEDWADIRNLLCPAEDPGKLVDLAGGAGDRHRGGRSVQILTFESGFRLVYKPRSLAVDVRFQELLGWLNERGDHPPFRRLEILDKGTHGWVEYVEAHGCTSARGIRRFYERQGGYLALLYALHAFDFHSENLIAAGEHPVLVDLESLFHHDSVEAPTQATTLAEDALGSSVLAIGLLPQRVWGNAEHEEGIDVSGLGGGDGQMSPFRLPYWEGAATDEMRLARKRMEVPGKSNRPTLNKTEVDVLEHLEGVIRGFDETYKLLVRHRDELLSDGGPLARFSDVAIRYIARDTQTYTLYLDEGLHPNLSKDALDRDRFFDNFWVSNRDGSKLADVFVHERHDLLRGDVPLFATRPDSRDLTSASGRRVPGYLDETGLALARRRILRLDDDDLAKQTWFIRASFTTLVLGDGRDQWPTYEVTEPEEEADPAALLAAACEVGDRLERLALQGEQDATWLGVNLVNERVWSLVPSGPDLFDGLSGIALFLGYLGDLSGEERYTSLAERAVATILGEWQQAQTGRGLELPEHLQRQIGAFHDLGGTIYALSHLDALWNRPELTDEAENLSTLLPPLIDEDEEFDLVGGAAGCIRALLSLQSRRPSRRTMALASRCGDHLVDRAISMEHGVGWARSTQKRAPTGLSHGAAGIAHALLDLAVATGQRRFREAACQAFAYERSLFSPEEGNWPDVRGSEERDRPADDPEDSDRFPVVWCYGAPGIGLGRLRAMGHLDDPELRSEVDVALKTTLGKGFGINHSLCHGALGNLELPLEVARSFGDDRLLSRVYRIAGGILRSGEERGWISGIPAGVETPGLMTGLAGIGYGLLRLAEPRRVPSVLLVEPPRDGPPR